jgi:hypothetical protein
VNIQEWAGIFGVSRALPRHTVRAAKSARRFSDREGSGVTHLPTPAAVPTLESPSLFAPGAGAAPDRAAAYEVKFLLTEDAAREVEARVRGRLAPDPHADPALGGAYRTTSLYTDTPDFAVFRRLGGRAGSKFRVRRYGAAGPVFLERKDKDGDRVRKCRAPVGPGELGVLADPNAPPGWAGGWFHRQLGRRGLRPVCRVTYDRVAYLGQADGGTVRVTFDRAARGEPADGWDVTPVAGGPELLPGRVICEFKFRLAMPLVFKEIVGALGLAPAAVSKYRRFVLAAGLAPAGGGPADA